MQEPKVYISGLPADVQNDDLQEIFSKFGEITDIYVKPKDTFAFAFVTFAEMENAQDAIQDMNGRNIKGKRVKMDLARPRNRATQSNRGGDRPRGGPRNCFKCNEEGHFARECPNPDGGNGGSGGGNRGGNNNPRGNYNSSRNDRNSRSKSRSPQRQAPKKRSASHSRSASPKRNQQKPQNQRKRSVSRSRSGSLKKAKESRSRSRSVDKNKKRVARRRSPSHSRSP